MVLAKASIDKKQAETLLDGLFTQFQTNINRGTAPTPAEFEKFLSRNFHFTTNGREEGKSLMDYVSRISFLQKKYSNATISSFIAEPLIVGNKAVVQYDIKLTPRTGPKTEVSVIAIATIDENHITNWTQVAHEKGTGRWDK